MNSMTSIATLYGLISKIVGPREARKAITAMVSNVIFDLQEQDLPMTDENISKKLNDYTADFINASKAQAA